MIVASAIKHKGVVYTGVRHCEIFRQILRIHPDTKTPITNNKSPQGFVTDKNIFMGRDEALDHAYESGQIKDDGTGNFNIIGGVLTSEDLW